ncbi:MAG TPA: hypothetical protein VK524_33245 [Polyangiaceae bacterium]|nr:hypothetical protein [Polyangiaceae bacterium]
MVWAVLRSLPLALSLGLVVSGAAAPSTATEQTPASGEPSKQSLEPKAVTAPEPEENAVMRVIRRMESSVTYSSYSHVTRVNERTGSYEFDCSGMAAWVLRRSAPQAHSAVLHGLRNSRPLARNYYFRIAATRPGKARWGWQRVSRVEDTRPGDVIAWLKPEILRSPYTGHVAFVTAPPDPLPGTSGAFLVRIADASSYQHQDDSRVATGNTGFGFGTILVQADPETGAPVAYGWFGQWSRWVLPAKMAIGRPVR